MVLEQLYPLRLIEENPTYALLLGLCYSVIGIGASVILFPEDPAIVAVAFIAIMIYPTLNKLLKQEEEIESKKEEFHPIRFLMEHRYVIYVYGLFFLGSLLAFSLFALILPNLATNHIFENQIQVLYRSRTGNAIFSFGLLRDLISNNMGVFVLCFLAAFVFGDGGIFLIIWNASVWGTIFGNIAKTAAESTAQNPFFIFLIVIGVVSPHMILEAFSYVCSGSAGGIISKGLLKESFMNQRFRQITKNTTIFLIFAFIILLIAAVIETYVLGNVRVYQNIVRQSFLR